MERNIIIKTVDVNSHIYSNAINFFLDSLLTDVETKTINAIDVKFNSTLKDDGECEYKSTKLIIKIKSGMDFISTIKTIAHECVHAKQYITKELRYNKFGEWVWKNRSFGRNPYKSLTEDEIYTKLPWEREAACKEVELFMEFIANYLDSNS